MVVVAGLAVTGALLWAIIAFMGQTPQHHHRPGRYHRHHRVDRDHRRLLHRLLRTTEGRGPGRADRPHQRGQGVRQRVPHRAGRRRGVVAGRGHPLFISIGARCEGSPCSSGISTILDVVVTYFFTRPVRDPAGSDAGGATEAKGDGRGQWAGRQARRWRPVSPDRGRPVATPTARQAPEHGGGSAELEEAFEEELELAAEEPGGRAPGEKRPNVFVRLYRGETSFDFIGNRRWWFGASALIILLGVISLGTRGLNVGIDFKGGQSWLVTSQTLTVAQATSAVEAAGVSQPTVVQLTNQLNGQKQIQVTADLNSKSVAERRRHREQRPGRLGQGGRHLARQRQLRRGRARPGAGRSPARPSRPSSSSSSPWPSTSRSGSSSRWRWPPSWP